MSHACHKEVTQDVTPMSHARHKNVTQDVTPMSQQKAKRKFNKDNLMDKERTMSSACPENVLEMSTLLSARCFSHRYSTVKPCLSPRWLYPSLFRRISWKSPPGAPIACISFSSPPCGSWLLRIRDFLMDFCYNETILDGIPVHIVDPLAGTISPVPAFLLPGKGKRGQGKFPGLSFFFAGYAGTFL